MAVNTWLIVLVSTSKFTISPFQQLILAVLTALEIYNIKKMSNEIDTSVSTSIK